MRYILLAAVVAAIWVASSPAFAWPEDPHCKPLRLLNQVQLEPLGKDPRVAVPIRVAGYKMDFLLDTGAPISMISQRAAEYARLPVVKRRKGFMAVDQEGRDSGKAAVARNLDFGRMHDPAVAFYVMGNPAATGGLFGMDFLVNNDLDLDFTTNTLRIFSSNHCDGRIMYWKAPVLGFVELKPGALYSNRILADVMLDGYQVEAIIDTGAARSQMNLELAKGYFHLKPGDAQTEKAGTFAPGVPYYFHTFKKLSFGDVEVLNPRLELIPDMVSGEANKSLNSDTRHDRKLYGVRLPEMIIGMDILRQLHVYFAFKERKMFVSPAASTIADPTPATPVSGTSAASTAGAK